MIPLQGDAPLALAYGNFLTSLMPVIYFLLRTSKAVKKTSNIIPSQEAHFTQPSFINVEKAYCTAIYITYFHQLTK